MREALTTTKNGRNLEFEPTSEGGSGLSFIIIGPKPILSKVGIVPAYREEEGERRGKIPKLNRFLNLSSRT